MVVYRQEVRPFSDKQIALLQNFAAQAVIAMENARLLTETREALEQQTATSEVLQVINSSPGDLDPVFDAMLEKATRLCDAACGVLRIWDGEHFHIGAVHGEPRFSDWVRQRGASRPPPDDPLGRIIKGEGIVHFADASDDAGYMASPGFRQAVEVSGMRSGITVPLSKDDALLGAITVYRQEVRPFSEKQIALLQNFAAQAVIAMENARLLTETREALEQQTATAKVLQVINASPGDLAPVFDAMLDKAMHLCEAAFGTLWTYDGGAFHAAALHRVPKAYAEVQSGVPVPTRPGSVLGKIAAGSAYAQVLDAATEESYQSTTARALVELGGARTVAGVALRKDDALVGAITIYRQEVRLFSEKQIVLLQNFAAQAVIAMENARLLTETQEALEQQTATAEVLQVINSSPGYLAPVFDTILEKAHSLCGADFGSLLSYDGKFFRRLAVRDPSASPRYAELMAQGARPHVDDPYARLVRGERLVHDADLTEVAATATHDRLPMVEALLEIGIRTQLFVPLRKDDRLLGAISANRREARPFSDKQIALLQNFAAQAVIAMENARLISETREALEQQTATAEVLQVINSSPGNLAPVFDAMLEKAMRLCDAAFGGLFVLEGEQFRAVATCGLPSSLNDFVRRGFTADQSNPLLRGGAMIDHIVDLSERTLDKPGLRAAVELGGACTMLNAALRKDDAMLGSFSIFRREVRPFSDKQIALLRDFAAQAVIAMENARLLTETREALEQQTATAEVLQVINSSPGDLAPVFDAILEKAHVLCDAVCGGLIIRNGQLFHTVAIHGEPDFVEFWSRQAPFQLGDRYSPIEPLLRGEAVVHLVDAREGDGYRDTPAYRHLIDAAGARTLLLVPLRKEGVFLGAITAFRQVVRPFSGKQIALLENFAEQAVIAMENARLLGELRQRTEEVDELNRGLEARVAEQVEELGRVGRLKRFLAPQLAELIVSQGDEKILESHRREIVVVFCDLRGYTAFTETAEPEEVLDFLREYHGALGPLVSQFEGTLDQFSGDGIMVFFNDPVPIPDPAARAVKMAVAMREAAGTLIADWRERGRDLGFGAGIAQGYATLGQIGFSERSGYTAIGTVCNVAARLCAEAKDGQILLSQRVNVALKGSVATEQVGALALKGLTQPVVAYDVPLRVTQPALRVIEGDGPQSV
jgi:GAF domain-containing protein